MEWYKLWNHDEDGWLFFRYKWIRNLHRLLTTQIAFKWLGEDLKDSRHWGFDEEAPMIGMCESFGFWFFAIQWWNE